jgi:1,4-dihydroxy-2-naphthoate octaprenyltransferase
VKILKRLWQGFWQVADPKIWIASTLPMALGGALSYGMTGIFSVRWFLISVAGVYLIEIGKNAANDLVDYLSGVDLMVAPEKITSFSGGKRAIVDGKLTLSEAMLVAVTTLAAGSIVGIYIAVFREPAILYIGTAGLFLAAAYSLPPFKLCYRGWGELAVGIAFGPLIVSGMFMVQTHTLPWQVILASLPIGFLITNVLWINQYPDFEADRACKKMNWVVRLGRKRALKVHAALFIVAYTTIVALFLVTRNPFWLLSFCSLPFVLRAIKVAASHTEDFPIFTLANINTIITYQLTGAAMVLAGILTRFFVYH